jgi:flagellar basal-body rod modification protein FlgD
MFPIIPLVGALLPTVVNAIKNTFAATPATPSGKEDFLKLLVSQLQSQEGPNSVAGNPLITASTSMQPAAQRGGEPTSPGGAGGVGMTTSALLGRPVRATAARFDYAGGPVSLPYALGAPVSNALLELTDAKGAVIARIPLGPKSAGAHSFDFNGPSLGRAVPSGQYRYRILAPDATGNFTALPAISGAVTSVRLEHGVPMLALGSRKVTLADLAMVGGAGL